MISNVILILIIDKEMRIPEMFLQIVLFLFYTKHTTYMLILKCTSETHLFDVSKTILFSGHVPDLLQIA